MSRFLDLLQQISSEPIVEPAPEPIVEPAPEPIVEPAPEPIVKPVVLNTSRNMIYKRKRK